MHWRGSMVLVTSALLLAAAPARAEEKPKLAVLDVQITGVDESVGPLLTEVLTTEVANLGKHQVIGSRDVAAMLGFEAERQLVQCDDASCLSEIGGALGVDRILVGHVGKVGETFLVTVKIINIAKATTERRAYNKVKGEVDVVIDEIKRAVGELFAGEPVPGEGGATAAAGGSTTSGATAGATATGPEKKSGSGPKVGPLQIALLGVGLVGVGAGAGFGSNAASHAKA